jgi:hypothetical protein
MIVSPGRTATSSLSPCGRRRSGVDHGDALLDIDGGQLDHELEGAALNAPLLFVERHSVARLLLRRNPAIAVAALNAVGVKSKLLSSHWTGPCSLVVRGAVAGDDRGGASPFSGNRNYRGFSRTWAEKLFFSVRRGLTKNSPPSAPRGILKIVHYFGADGVGDPAPNRCAVVIVLGSKFMGARGAFLEGLICRTA